MYRSFGFVEDGRRREYYKDNGEDAILMSLDHLPGG
jgi:ribosomal protein S18 acetylase RimI-like enzyme